MAQELRLQQPDEVHGVWLLLFKYSQENTSRGEKGPALGKGSLPEVLVRSSRGEENSDRERDTDIRHAQR